MDKLFAKHLLSGSILAIILEIVFFSLGGVPDDFGHLLLSNSQIWTELAGEDFFEIFFYLIIILLPLILISYSIVSIRMGGEPFKGKKWAEFISIPVKILLVGSSILTVQYLPIGAAVVSYSIHKACRKGLTKFLMERSVALIVAGTLFFIVAPEQLRGLGFTRYDYFDYEYVWVVSFWLAISTVAYLLIAKVQSLSKWFLIIVVPLIVFIVGLLFAATHYLIVF